MRSMRTWLKYGLLWLAFFAPKHAWGQEIDAMAYLDKAISIRAQHPDSSRFYTDAIFEAFKDTEPDSTALFAIMRSANLRRQLNDFAKAREVLTWAKQQAEQQGFERHLAFAYQILGIVDNQQGRYQSASENFLKGLQIYDRVGDAQNKAVLLKELGIVHERLKMNDKALEYGLEALRVIRSVGDSSMIAGFLGDVGTMHQNMGKLEEALPLQLESMRMNTELGMEVDLPFNQHNIGDIYLQMGKLDSAEVYTQMAYDGFMKHDIKFAALYSMMNLGVVNMERGRYNVAEDYLKRAYDRAKEYDGLYEQTMLLEKLSTLYERMGNYRAALDFMKQGTAMSDSLSNADRERTILDMAESYKSEQATREIERLREQEALSDRLITTQQVFLIVVSLVLIAFVVALIRSIKSNRYARRLNHDLVEANNNLTSMSEERNNLIHVMAHDLRTPLAQVTGLSELLKDTAEISDEQLEYVQLIESASRNGLSIITQMMESNSNRNMAKSTGERTEVDLQRVIDSSLSLYEAQARTKNIHIVFDNEAADPVIKSDPQSIRRVIDNLVSNAVKYTYPNTEVHVNLKSDPDSVTIQVQDNGPGFSDDDKRLLFRKFTTLSARPTGNETSTGLGLAIVNDLLVELNGSIHLEDGDTKGACFRVTLPRDIRT